MIGKHKKLSIIESYLRKQLLMITQNKIIPMKEKLWKPISAMNNQDKPFSYKITR